MIVQKSLIDQDLYTLLSNKQVLRFLHSVEMTVYQAFVADTNHLQWVEIENFFLRSVLSVKQDFYAKVFTTNLTAMVVNAFQKQVDKATIHRKHDYRVNFPQTLSKMKNTLIELLLLSAQQLQNRLRGLIDYMACTIEPIRSGRSYSRPNSKSKNRIFYCNYKRAM